MRKITVSQKVIYGFLILLFTLSCSKEKKTNKAGEKMQTFVANIATQARSTHPDFIIIPQNGIELAFNELDASNGINATYFNAIDGMGLEGLFFGENTDVEDDRLKMAQKLVASKPILVADYLNNNELFASAVEKALLNHFICFPRLSGNYDYTSIPDTILSENAQDIYQINMIKNYLYLISDTQFGSKQDYLSALQNTNYDLLIIDLFFRGASLTKDDVAQLKQKANGANRLVIAYMNIGAAEKYRYYWKEDWKIHHPNWLKKNYDGYTNEIWVKFWNKDWQNIIYKNQDSYLHRVINAGFDGVYLDNVEAYYYLYNE